MTAYTVHTSVRRTHEAYTVRRRRGTEGSHSDEGDRPGHIRHRRGPDGRDIDKPAIGDDEVLVRVRAAGVNPADWAIMSGLPVHRASGLRAAQAEAAASEARTWRAPSRPSAPASPGSGSVTTSSAGAAARMPSTRPSPRTRWQPSRPTSRSSRPLRSRWPAMVALQALRDHGHVRARRQGPDQRRVRRHRHVRGPDREGVRRGGDGRVQRAQRRARPLDRRRPRHRLHAAGLHPGRRALRLHPRQRREPLAVRAPRRAHPDRLARAERRQLREPLVRRRRSA